MLHRFIPLLFILLTVAATAQPKRKPTVIEVAEGWAKNSVNAVVFRKNSLVTYKDTQYIAFYDNDQFVVLGKRRTGGKQWELQKTAYKGNARDAHNTISIMADGDGYLHLSWDHHNNPLNYCKSNNPGSLVMTAAMSMTGRAEKNVSYPEFYKLPDGDLLFLYRDGGSGKGNLVVNKYSTASRQWTQLHHNLVDGEGKRNAYWQACTDNRGTIHLSWVWRETPDVASNHDMCYARSTDGGRTWEKSTGEKYQLPITAATAEYALTIPQQSELINQTSMSADESGNPYIASFWRDAGTAVPQYHIVYKKEDKWISQNPGFRKTAFSLSGAGTKRIPISRPQIVVRGSAANTRVMLIFRDAERDNKVSVAMSKQIGRNKWKVFDLVENIVGSWEPTYDTELWKHKSILNIFLQKVEQADAEGQTDFPAQPVKVIEWKPVF